MSEESLSRQIEQLAMLLLSQKKQLAVAESCTGGWLAKVLTDLPGSSEWFERGFVTYSNQAKQEMLGVTAETLAASGAVSADTVAEMANGSLRHSHADLSVAISGIAGPGGGSEDKPVGLVWFGFAQKTPAGIATMTESQQFDGEREAVREQAVHFALNGLLQLLEQHD